MHEVDVVAADVRERVRISGSHPVLEIGVAIVPLLEQAGCSKAKISEAALLVGASGHQAAIVEALVVLDSDEEIAGASPAGDVDGIGMPEHKLRHDDDGLGAFGG